MIVHISDSMSMWTELVATRIVISETVVCSSSLNISIREYSLKID